MLGDLTLGWGHGRHAEGKLQFHKLDTQMLVQQALGSDLPGDGHLSGMIEITGDRMQRWSDVALSVEATLSRAQPRRLPVVSGLRRVVRTVSFSRPIDEGHIRATYDEGVVNIQQLTLSGPMLELLIHGSVSAKKRLNLTILVRTGRRSIDRRVAGLVGGQLGNRIVGILADRLVQIHATGTIRRPVLHVKPLSIQGLDVLHIAVSR